MWKPRDLHSSVSRERKKEPNPRPCCVGETARGPRYTVRGSIGSKYAQARIEEAAEEAEELVAVEEAEEEQALCLCSTAISSLLPFACVSPQLEVG